MFDYFAGHLAAWIITVGSFFISPVAATDPTFADFNLDLAENNHLVLSIQLRNWRTEDLDRILRSGQKVLIRFQTRVQRKGGLVPQVRKKEFFHQLKFSLVDETFRIFLSETGETLETSVLSEAVRIMSGIRNLDLVDRRLLSADAEYVLHLEAALEQINLPGLANELDMMRFWRNRRPVFHSPPFTLRSRE